MLLPLQNCKSIMVRGWYTMTHTESGKFNLILRIHLDSSCSGQQKCRELSPPAALLRSCREDKKCQYKVAAGSSTLHGQRSTVMMYWVTWPPLWVWGAAPQCSHPSGSQASSVSIEAFGLCILPHHIMLSIKLSY